MKFSFALLSSLSLAALIAPVHGQGPQVAFGSLTSNGQLPTGPVLDEDVLCLSKGSTASIWLPSHSWETILRDVDGDGVWDAPSDIDAISSSDRSRPLSLDTLVFSLLSNQGPFEDGDLLQVQADGSIATFLSEADLRAALGTTSTSIDVDAATIGSSGSVAFSLTSDLSQSAIGPISDGDILMWDSASGITRLHSEADLQQIAEMALGSGIGSITDCLALSQDPSDGTLVFVIQSPSAHDADAIRVTGELVTGFAEGDWGFTSAAELDALCLLQPTMAKPSQLAFTPPVATLNQFVTMDVSAGTPGSLFLIVLGSQAGFQPFPSLAGMGGLAIDAQDATHVAMLAQWPVLIGFFDGQGAASLTFPAQAWLPTPFDMVFQIVDLSNGAIGAPAAIRIQ